MYRRHCHWNNLVLYIINNNTDRITYITMGHLTYDAFYHMNDCENAVIDKRQKYSITEKFLNHLIVSSCLPKEISCESLLACAKINAL